MYSFELVTPQMVEALIGLRRSFHMTAEIGWQEEQTIEHVCNYLTGLGLEPQVLPGGVICDLIVNPKLPMVGFRADLDALPITEATGSSFASKNHGCMHACGHDAHTAMLLMAANALCQHKGTLKRNIRFLFTQAEEIPPGGEVQLIEAGGVEGLSEIFGLHLYTEKPSGEFHTKIGNFTVHSDRATIKLKTTGGHVKDIHQMGSLSDVYAYLVQAFRSRCTSPFPGEAFVHCALPKETNAANVLPAECSWELSIRARDSKSYEELRRAFDSVIQMAQKQFPRVQIEVDYRPGHIPVVNDLNLTAHSVLAAKLVIDHASHLNLPGLHLDPNTEQILGGESFGRFHHDAGIPTSFMMLGAGGAGLGDPVHGYGHHDPRFNPDERVLILGLAYWLTMATLKR